MKNAETLQKAELFDSLMDGARYLGYMTDTPWAEKHPGSWEDFLELIETLHKAGELSDGEYNVLALTAFYDVPDGLKGEPDEDGLYPMA